MNGAPSRRQACASPSSAAFTLVEMMVSMVIIVILMTVLVQVISGVQRVWMETTKGVSQFEEVRAGLGNMSRRLSEATLDGYWAYQKDSNGRDYYARSSDCHFLSGPLTDLSGDVESVGHGIFFQAPFGFSETATGDLGQAQLSRMDSLLNCLGYYVDYGGDLERRPPFLATDSHLLISPERKRFRLMEFRQPAEQMILFSSDLALNNPATARSKAYTWFRGPFKDGRTLRHHSKVIAENVLALIVAPYWLNTNVGTSSTTSQVVEDFYYDSRERQWGGSSTKAVATQHQLPPRVRITVIATDEPSYQRFSTKWGDDSAAAQIAAVLKDRFKQYSALDEDLSQVGDALDALKLSHRVFSVTVAIRGSKWVIEKEL